MRIRLHGRRNPECSLALQIRRASRPGYPAACRIPRRFRLQQPWFRWATIGLCCTPKAQSGRVRTQCHAGDSWKLVEHLCKQIGHCCSVQRLMPPVTLLQGKMMHNCPWIISHHSMSILSTGRGGNPSRIGQQDQDATKALA